MSTIRMKPSNKLVNPMDLKVSDISIEDIAHHLSKQCRFGGGVDGDEIYSVAQHAVLVSIEVEQEVTQMHGLRRKNALNRILWGLHHDDSEAYLIDVPRPIKHHPLFAAYREAEAKAMLVICAALDLDGEEPSIVKIADRRMCDTESRDLRGKTEGEPFAHIRIVSWSPRHARLRFLDRHQQILREWQ